VLLSILIPVYNEKAVVRSSLAAVLAAPLPPGIDRELVIVDDCSRDGTFDILRELAGANPEIRLFRHEVNQGKGAAVRTAIGHASGEFCLIQDADLEYDPNEYPILLKPLLEGRADAVFGSRYMAGESRRVLPYWHTQINLFLTFLSNLFSNLSVTDMETCYKVFRTDLLKSIPIRSNRFGFEPEITMKCAKRKLRIYEVPISYHGRTYEEGKKIGWKDGVQALVVILKFWLIDDLYNWPHNRVALVNLTRTPGYVSAVSALVRPLLGDSVIEVGAGIGTFAGRLMGRRLRYLACEHDPLLLHSLENRFLKTPNVETRDIAPEDVQGFAPLAGQFDSAVCLNVLEGLERPDQAVRALALCLTAGGRLVLLAPQGASLYGSIDRSMGQKRRFERRELEQMLRAEGLEVEQVWQLNKAAAPLWWLNSKALGRPRLSKVSLKIFDKTIWLWRLLDKVLPWNGLSLLMVARKRAA
jgi:glycosyltransferase involved in cell wall biosynthesis